MKAARILQFGPPSVITNGDLPQPEAAAEQLLVRVKAAGLRPTSMQKRGLTPCMASPLCR
jgi:NADPH:quinone reductase-like Zn-dependent oxidoreductase